MLIPSELRWTDPRPPFRDDPQDRITKLLRHPSFAQVDENDDCPGGRTWCITHDQPYQWGKCGPGLAHELRWECSLHGPEIMGVDHVMAWNPEGFDPPLTAEQLTWFLGDAAQ